MKQCPQCNKEYDESWSVCINCSTKLNAMVSSPGRKDMPIRDFIFLCNELRKEVNFDKSDSELAPDELALKEAYHVMDKTLEDAIGKDVKKDLDDKRNMMELLSKLQKNFDKVIYFAKETEKNFIKQAAHLIVHCDKQGKNEFGKILNRMGNDIVNSENRMSSSERIDAATKMLEIIKLYQENVSNNLYATQDMVGVLLPALEKTFEEINFDLVIDDKTRAENTRSKLKEWIGLSKDLYNNRKKAIKAVDEDLCIEEIIPKFIISNGGDVTKTMSATELKTRGETMIRLFEEFHKREEEIESKRSRLSEEILGKPDEYMNTGNQEESKRNNESSQNLNPLEAKAWYRFTQVIYVCLWIIGLGVAALTAAQDSNFMIFIYGTVIVWIVLGLLRKAFLYVALGKNQ